MRKTYLWLLLIGSFTSMKAQTTYYSKASATDFTAVGSWGTATDGTGTSPTSISNADNFVIQNSSAMTLPANASVRQLTINSGSLTIANNSLSVSRSTGNNSTLLIAGGTLTQTGGAIILNGNFLMTSGAFNQSGGNITLDGNDNNTTATSVATGVALFSLTGGTPNCSAGAIVIVDPHVNTYSTGSGTNRSVNIGLSAGTAYFTGTHTFVFGDGISTTAGNTDGFVLETYSSGYSPVQNVTVNGGSTTGRWVTASNNSSTSYGAHLKGDLIINANSEFRQGYTSGLLAIGGNITNNGTMTVQGSAATSGLVLGTNSAFTVTTAQNISGTGVFRNSTTSSTANFSYLTINNPSTGGVTFSNANSLLSGANTGTVSGTLTFTNGIVNTGSNTFVLGVSGTSVGTLSYTAGGFSSGSTFSRWYGTTGSGTTIAASTVPSAGAGTYPFVMGNPTTGLLANHFHRATAALTTAGQMAVKFNGATGTSSITPLTEGSLTFNKQTNANWVVSTLAGYDASATHTFAIQGQGAYTSVSPNVTLLNNGVLVGTAQAGTSLPMGQRAGVPFANVAATYSIAAISSEIPIETAQSGPWESTSTWVGGVVPTCFNAAILSGHTVTVSASTTATPNNVIINVGGSLSVTGGSITVGCTNKNNFITNNGTLSVSGGSLLVNGNINSVSGSTFAHTGGNINVDGNDAGATATSVASGTHIVNIATGNVTLSGGTMTIVDPHAASSTSSYAFSYSGGTAIDNTLGWTLKFGDGTSTDAGGTTATASAAGGFIWNNAGSKIYYENVIIDGAVGTNRYVSNSSTTIGINTLTINANGELRMPTSGISIAGNFTNNGTFTHTASTLNFQNFKNNGTASASTTPQTVSGTGVFRNNIVTASSTANFTSILINNSSSSGVTFANTNTLLSGANTGTVSGTLTMTTGFVNTGANSFVLGVSTASNGTLSYTAGGFTAGSTFARWWPTTTGGATITASTTPTGTASGVYPFAIGTSSAFVARNLYLNQTTAATTGGRIAVQYNDAAGTSTVSIVDGSYTVDTRSNGNWVVSQTGITGSSVYSMAINAQGIYGASNGNSRITLASAPAAGTYQAGTSYVNAQRTAVPLANLADTYYVGLSSSDIPFVSVASGDWNSSSIWNKGTVPTCTDLVQIGNGTTVTVNSVGNGSKNVTINTSGTLVIASGDLTVGCTLNNNFLTNNGTLTVSGGTLNINGNIAVNSGAKFNQSGGNISVDGNNAGSATGSVASGTNIVNFTPSLNTDINLTGGTFTIVDPHYTTTTTFSVSAPSAGAIAATGTHTFRFGDGISTDNGGTNGFNFYSWAGTGIFKFKNVILETVTGGSNRFFLVSGTYYNFAVTGDLTINSGAEYRNSGTSGSTGASYFAGNIINNGTFTTLGTVFFADVTSSSSIALTVSAATNPQTIGGTGVFQNLATASTANLTSLTVNNTSSGGVTLNVPLSVSGTLTLTAGKVNTSSANLLTLGTATAAGTLSGGSTTAYIVGPFARTIASSNTSYILYPVGKTAYAPISLAPATTVVTNMKAETFDTNSGTASTSIQNLSAKRWEAPLVSGAFSTINVRLGDNAITSINFPVIAPTASGVYDNLFGNTGTYAAGTPNTTQSTTALATASYTGYLSYAEIAAALATNEIVSNKASLKAYPNPFMDVLTISDVKDVKSIMISDMSGKIVKTIQKPESTLHLRDLNAGMYLVILNMNDGSRQTIKAIKK